MNKHQNDLFLSLLTHPYGRDQRKHNARNEDTMGVFCERGKFAFI